MIMEINLDISTIMEIYDTMQFGKGVVSPLNYKEYENMALMKSVVEENTSGIVESVTQFQKDAVIDEYTQQLIEEGLI